jgi:hypothetical protein
MMAGADTTTIGRARVAGWPDGANRLAAQLALAQTLAGADLRPPGMAPAATLIVRRLPALGSRLALRPGGRVDPTWERAGRSALADLARSAIRPWDGPAPAGCQAVLFRDEAELLACLALDISLGRAAERWWWRAFLRRWGRLSPDVVAALLAESPRATPAALRMLAERDKAHQVLHRMTPSEALQVLRAVCEAFDAPHLAQAAATMGRQPQLPASTGPSPPSGQPERTAPPWQRFTARPARPGGLAPHNACLLGVSLALAQAPTAARSVAFAQAVERWWRGQVVPPASDGQPEALGNAQAFRTPLAPQLAPADPSPVASPLATPAAMLPPPAVSAGSELPTFPKVRNSDPGTAPALLQLAPDRSRAARRDPAERDVADQPQHVPTEPVAPAEMLDGAFTELGGVLFLINVMQRLDLPDCFEPDWRLASQVGPWSVLELLGRALLPDAARLPTFPKVGNLAADPLWAALAVLAGRQIGEPAGANVTGPDSMQIPAFWARWLGAGSVTGKRIDLAGVQPLDGLLLAGASFAVRRWLAVVTPLLRQMLAAALGIETGDAAAALLLRRGQLYVTPSHVDLVMPLDGVSLPVRLAGLDFDPGWLPAYGRVVQVHYE